MLLELDRGREKKKSVYLHNNQVHLATRLNASAHRGVVPKHPGIVFKKVFFFVFKNTLFYMLHARRIHIKSHIVHHTIYKFGEKEDRYKKSRYSRTSQPREEVVRFGRHAPRSDACRCYHGAVCLSVPADVGSSVQVAINCMLKRDLHAYHSILRERRHLQERSGTGPVYKQPSLDLKIKQEVFK